MADATSVGPTERGRHAAPDADDSEPSLSRARTAAWAGRLVRGIVDRMPVLTAAIGAGLLLCVSFPPFGWWYTAIVAFAVLAWLFTRESIRPVGAFGYGFLFGLAFYLPLLPWTGSLVGVGPWIALSILCAVFPGLFGLLAFVVRRLPGWPVWFAALWVAQEWLKCTVPFGGFPWGVAAFGQTGGPLLVIAKVGGAPLLSFAVALAGFSLTALALAIYDWWRRGAAESRAVPPRVVLPGVFICLVLFATAALWPGVHRSGIGAGNDPTINVAAVQGNVPRLGLDFNAQRREVLDYHVRETLQLADDIRAGRVLQPQFVIWPENSSDIDPMANSDAAQQIFVAAQAVNAPILVGAVLARPDSTPDNPTSTNTVLVWDPNAGPTDRHDKKIVQPFGEYLPWRSFFKHLSGYADRAGYFVPGTGTGVVQVAGVPVGVTTCWEVIFDRAPRESVLNGAQLLAVPTNNATFDQQMSEQQLAFAKLRAVEHDRYTVVAGTTGISAVIAPDGREIARTGFFEPAYLEKQVHLKTSLTPATHWEPIMQWGLIAIAGAALLAAILHNGWFMRRRHRRASVSAPAAGDMNEGAT
ncbi:MAG: apolipoprotein N-acyltransferase [Mycobacterium sp.]|jgi:apolipoprotein N-acyltransferase|nr:apolipoprotein N-acyltransferase [Mycobacterium sp.]